MKNEIEIPIKFPGLNQIITEAKNAPKLYSLMKKKYTGFASLYTKKLKRCTRPVFVEFIWKGNRMRDPDNIAVGGKFILDAMVKSQRIPDDSQKWIKGINHKFEYSKTHSVIIKIKEI